MLIVLFTGFAFLTIYLLLAQNAEAWTLSGGVKVPVVKDETPYADLIAMAGRTWGVETALIKAIIRQESNFNPNAENKEDPLKDYDSSYGLMQVRTQTAEDFGYVKEWTNPTSYEISRLFDPQSNITIGTRFLASLLGKYPFDIAVQMYNTGEKGFNVYGYRAASYLEKVKGFYNDYKT